MPEDCRLFFSRRAMCADLNQSPSTANCRCSWTNRLDPLEAAR